MGNGSLEGEIRIATDEEKIAEPARLVMRDVVGSIKEATGQNDVKVNDLAVHPSSGAAYVSYRSLEGPGIVRILGEDVKAVDVSNAKHSKIELTNAPAPDGDGRRSRRAQCITDLAFLDGSLLVAGLSKDRDGSRMRSLAFPFAETDAGATIHIYHGAHGKDESSSPAQTFVPLNIGGEPNVVAAYICTPLVTYPVASLSGEDDVIQATTVAELGNRNKPIDMLSYEKDGKPFLLLANSRRGVMKIAASEVEKVDAIKERVGGGGTAGLTYDTIENLKGVVQLDKLGEDRVVAMIIADNQLVLQTFPLP